MNMYVGTRIDGLEFLIYSTILNFKDATRSEHLASSTVECRIEETIFMGLACCFQTICYCCVHCFLKNCVSQFFIFETVLCL